MSTVYIIFQKKFNDDPYIRGVFDTEEKAENDVLTFGLDWLGPECRHSAIKEDDVWYAGDMACREDESSVWIERWEVE